CAGSLKLPKPTPLVDKPLIAALVSAEIEYLPATGVSHPLRRTTPSKTNPYFSSRTLYPLQYSWRRTNRQHLIHLIMRIGFGQLTTSQHWECVRVVRRSVRRLPRGSLLSHELELV